MIKAPEIKKIYEEIQKKIFYMIPEKWEKIYLYASITERIANIPLGEMYFYYFPKGILKKNPVNVYEISTKFNIDEELYSNLINDLFDSIKNLREEYKKILDEVWTTITISIEKNDFTVEYGFDDIEESDYNRHIIWKYKYLIKDINAFPNKDRKIIKEYLKDLQNYSPRLEIDKETLYVRPMKNVADFKGIDMRVSKSNNEKKKLKEKDKKSNKYEKEEEHIKLLEKEENVTEKNQNNDSTNNQILFGHNNENK